MANINTDKAWVIKKNQKFKKYFAIMAYKLILTKKGAKLFDIPTDAAEKTDLAEKLPQLKTRMEKELLEWKAGVMKELNAVPK